MAESGRVGGPVPPLGRGGSSQTTGSGQGWAGMMRPSTSPLPWVGGSAHVGGGWTVCPVHLKTDLLRLPLPRKGHGALSACRTGCHALPDVAGA